MICVLDVAYGETNAVAAALTFNDWADHGPAAEYTTLISEVRPYESGQFYRRELPCLQAVINTIPTQTDISCFVVDSYVWLDQERKGLGGYLYEEVKPKAVIGVAKTKFRGASRSHELYRGESQNPLAISAAGIPLDVAVAHIAAMHGPYRLPTLIKRVDQLCRTQLAKANSE